MRRDCTRTTVHIAFGRAAHRIRRLHTGDKCMVKDRHVPPVSIGGTVSSKRERERRHHEHCMSSVRARLVVGLARRGRDELGPRVAGMGQDDFGTSWIPRCSTRAVLRIDNRRALSQVHWSGAARVLVDALLLVPQRERFGADIGGASEAARLYGSTAPSPSTGHRAVFRVIATSLR